MALRKIKAKWLDPNGDFIRMVNLYFTVGNGVYLNDVNVYSQPSREAFNSAINEATAGIFPKGLEDRSTYGTNNAVEIHKFFMGGLNGLPLTSLYSGTRLVLNNGSYIYFSNITENMSGDSGYTIPFIEYRTENDAVAYSFNWNQLYGGLDNTYQQNFFSTFFFPWEPVNHAENEWHLDEFYVIGLYEQSLGVTVPTWRGGIRVISASSNYNAKVFFDGIEYLDPDDPYPDDDSGGGDEPEPDGIPDNDDIPIPPLPDVDITDTGFITLYRPSLAQVKNLADYMWSDAFSLATFKKLFADPMDCILGFNILPVTVRAGDVSEVTVGNISTGVSMTECASQWVEFDCGTVNIGTPYDTYLDYSPYTKYAIYLPYIGLQTLSADDVVGKPIHLVYHIDALSCSCVAYLLCGDSVLYQFAGSCGYSIPLTGDSFRGMISSMISIATTVAGAIATGGMTAPLAIGAGASVAQNVISAKPEVKRSGSVGSSAGLMGVQTPYLLLEIPRICKPRDQHRFLGYPSFITDTVGNVGGYSEWESVILSGVPCTDEERASIEEILKGGVYNV